MSKNKKLIIIGAGAAGLLAAAGALELGADVTIYEKNRKPGRKLAITGKGRCNLSNTAPVGEFIRHFGSNGKFLRQAFARFFSDDLVRFLNSLAIETKAERGGRIFPSNIEAPQISEKLHQHLLDNGVKIVCGRTVKSLIIEGKKVTGIQTEDGNRDLAHAVIVATGGCSYPGTGSTGDGYKLAASVGHKVIPARPALVPLESDPDVCIRLENLALKNVNASLWFGGKKITDQFGEMQFMKYGLTGPIILTLSKQCVEILEDEPDQLPEISIDLKPALDNKKLDNRLLREFDQNGSTKFGAILKSLLPMQLIPVCIEQVNIEADKLGNQINAAERKELRKWLKDFRFTITGHRGFREALVTSGGVSLKEIDPRTMMSHKLEGLYFCGEVLDLDGDTGGFNLQAAFSTGWLAGMSAAEYLRNR